MTTISTSVYFWKFVCWSLLTNLSVARVGCRGRDSWGQQAGQVTKDLHLEEQSSAYCKMRTRGKSGCMFCGVVVVAGSGRRDDENNDARLILWRSQCSESLCAAFGLETTDNHKRLFEAGSYCAECVQLARDLDFVVRLISRLQTKQSKVLGLIRGKIREAYRRIRKKPNPVQWNDDDREAELVSRQYSSEQVLTILHNKLVLGASHDDNEMDTSRAGNCSRVGDLKTECLPDCDDNESVGHHFSDDGDFQDSGSAVENMDNSEESEDYEEDADSDSSFEVDKRTKAKSTKKVVASKVKQGCDEVLASKVKQGCDEVLASKVKQGCDEVLASKVKQGCDEVLTDKHDSAEGKKHKCGHCGVTFKERSDLQRHLLSSTCLRPRKCTICGRGFEDSYKVKRHERTHASKKSHECFICYKVFSSMREICSHQLSAHPRQDQVAKSSREQPEEKQDEPGQNTEHSESDNLEHLNDRVEPEANKSGVEGPWKPIIPPEKYVCGVGECTAKYHKFAEFKDHMLTAHKQVQKEHLPVKKVQKVSYKCHICGTALKSVRTVNEHFQEVHEEAAVKNHCCPVCKMVFKSVEEMTRHAEAHNEDGAHPFECLLCNNTLTNSTDLRKHVREEHYPQDLRCPQCPEVLNNRLSLQFHLDQHAKPKIPCHLCDYQAVSAKRLKEHMCSHSSRRDHMCSFCGQAFRHKGSLKRHVMSHTGVRPCRCRICGRGFKESDQLKKHEKVHVRQTSHECFVCRASFETINELVRHQTSHIGEAGIQPQEECRPKPKAAPKKPKKKNIKVAKKPKAQKRPRPFDNGPGFRKYRYLQRPDKCTACGMYAFPNEMINHAALHQGRDPFDCVICDEKFTNIVDLKRHVKGHWNLDFVCDICGDCFWHPQTLVTHRRNHSKEKSYKCPHCPYSSENSVLIADHISTHTGEMRHFCEICGKSFRWSRSMITHRRQHTGVMAHTCNVCKQSFSNMKQFKDHQLTHVADTLSFSCPICSRAFSSASGLATHTKRLHGVSNPDLDETTPDEVKHLGEKQPDLDDNHS